MGSFCIVNWIQCVSQFTLSAFTQEIGGNVLASGKSGPGPGGAYGITLFEANFASSVGLPIFFPCFLCATYLYNNSTLRTVQFISVALTFVGGWIRTLAVINGQYWWIVAG